MSRDTEENNDEDDDEVDSSVCENVTIYFSNIKLFVYS